jgi:hypothetical protein
MGMKLGLTQRETYIEGVGNKMPRKIFGPKLEEVTGK